MSDELSRNVKSLESFVNKNFLQLVNQEHPDLCDAVFTIGGDNEKKQSHYLCLSACFALHSPVFKSMLFGRMLESRPYSIRKNTSTSVKKKNTKGDEEASSVVGLDDEDGESRFEDKKHVILTDITPGTFEFLMSFCYGERFFGRGVPFFFVLGWGERLSPFFLWGVGSFVSWGFLFGERVD